MAQSQRQRRAYFRRWREKNRKRINRQHRRWWRRQSQPGSEFRARHAKHVRTWRAKPGKAAMCRRACREWRKENGEYHRAQVRKRYYDVRAKFNVCDYCGTRGQPRRGGTRTVKPIERLRMRKDGAYERITVRACWKCRGPEPCARLLKARASRKAYGAPRRRAA